MGCSSEAEMDQILRMVKIDKIVFGQVRAARVVFRGTCFLSEIFWYFHYKEISIFNG